MPRREFAPSQESALKDGEWVKAPDYGWHG